MSKYKISRYVETINFFENETEKTAIFNCFNGKFSIINRVFWEQFQNGNCDKIPQNVLDDFFVQDDVDEFQLVMEDNENSEAKTLYLAAMVSGNCNFGCDYCGQTHSNIKLSEENQNFMIQFIDKQLQTKKFEALSIGWFGGEPLIAMDVIENMTKKMLALCARENIKYSAKVPTNGSLLTEEVARKCVEELGFRSFCITIDGDEAEHNARRCLKGGQETFQLVYKNFKNLLKLSESHPDVNVKLRCNIDMRNSEAVFHVIDMLDADNLQRYKNLAFEMAPVHDWGNDAGKKSLAQKEFAELEIQALSKLIQIGFAVKPLPKRNTGCMYTNPISWMTDPMGNLFPCSELGLVDAYVENGVNKYQIGTLQEGVTCDRKIFPKHAAMSEEKSPCKKCKIFPTCGGACPKLWEEGQIIPCPPSKFNLKEKMLLAYLIAKNQGKV